MSNPPDKIVSREQLVAYRQELRRSGRKLVQCHGCFDVVHPGHIRYLKFAKSLGDVLLVSVSADDVVEKGHDRPLIPDQLRMENLAALEFVDLVSLSEEAWGGPMLEAIRPDIYVKGREYESLDDPRFASEKAIVEGYGGQVVFGSGDVVFSSTDIIRARGDTLSFTQDQIGAYCRRHDLGVDTLRRLIDGFGSLRVLVMGDPIMDRYVFCERATVAEESPILSVAPLEEVDYVGGAAVIASQMAALGARVTLVTTRSSDPLFPRYRAMLEDKGVELQLIGADDRPLYRKLRYVVGEQKLLKVNEGPPVPVSVQTVAQAIRLLGEEIPRHDGLVVSDFGYGLFGDRLAAAISETSARAGRPYFADVSTAGQANLLKFSKPRLATPTESELRFALADMESGLVVVAKRYLDRSGADEVIVTMGRRGSITFAPPATPSRGGRLRAAYLPALGEVTVDAVGAGDLFLSGTVLATLASATAPQGAYLGSALATLGVTRMGNVISDLPRLMGFLGQRRELQR